MNPSKKYIIGADEVGYGALAGPLVICGVKAPKEWLLEGLNDSKILSEKKRNIMRAKLFEEREIQFSIASRSNVEIDSVGVATALRDCYAEVFIKLYDEDCLLIADGNLKFDELAAKGYIVESIIKADTLVPSVMAASILAKTFRDDKMRVFHEQYPQYNWKSNVGYGAPVHLKAMREYGLSPLHRRSYKVKTMLDLYE